MRTRTAVFGGTFDPVHTGHCLVASSAIRAGVADEVWLMVSPENPLKSGRRMAPEADRLAMARMAAGRMEGLSASDFEFSLPRPSYTAETLRRLAAQWPDRDFRWMIGADNWLDFAKWREPETIIRDFGLIVYPRPGHEIPQGFRPLERMPEGWEGKVTFLEGIPETGISSTMVRRLAAEGQPLAFLTEKSVEDHILLNGLYRPAETGVVGEHAEN